MRLVKLTVFLSLWPVFFTLACLRHLQACVRGPARRWRMVSDVTRIFCSVLTFLFKIRITVEGQHHGLETQGHLIISNHLGYLDGIVLGSIFPLIFVSKREVRGWPLLGQWTALCGTVFIDRKQKVKIPVLVDEIESRLRQGANVLLFPEGTSSDGERLLPFQSVPFAAPLRIGAPIMPITLTYTTVNQQLISKLNRDLIYWYGDMDLVSHLWALLALRGIGVSVRIHPPIETTGFRNDSRNRKQLSRTCHSIIGGAAVKDSVRSKSGSTKPAPKRIEGEQRSELTSAKERRQ
jgi:lyso-ornithine lipid O-acyltransferase